jgi:sterol desaturase/sphingolipid hydroxylase (fatty acid hydroxylase superfamily)
MDPELQQLLALKSGLVLAAIVLFALYERLHPAEGGPLLLRLGRAGWNAWCRLGRNLGLFGLNALLSPVIVVPITWWAAGFETGLRPAIWSGWPGLLLDLLVLDLWIYWWHRANHEIQFLWRFHQVHHLDETLDTSSGLRFHFGEVVLSALARAVLIILLDIPLASVIVVEALVLVAAVFHHSDARLPQGLERALARLIITPSIHWVHHHAIRADTDSNYGTVFSFWDRLFSSRSRTLRFRGMPIGVERLRDRPLWCLVLAPFARKGGGRGGPPGAQGQPPPVRDR